MVPLAIIISVSSVNAEEPILEVENIKYISSLKPWHLEVNDFVLRHSGTLKIKIRNVSANTSPKAMLYADLIYSYARTQPEPVIYPPTNKVERLKLGQIEVSMINPNDTINLSLETSVIKFNKPGVDPSVSLHLVIRSLDKNSTILYESYEDYRYSTESEAKDSQKGKLNLIVGVITLIIVFITFVISLPTKRIFLSIVLIIAVMIFAYLIYKSGL
jgi:hypothetical protein